MTDLFYFLSRYSADTLISAAISAIAALIVRRKFPDKTQKFSSALPFVSGTALYIIWRMILGAGNMEDILAGAASSGGLAVVLYAVASGIFKGKHTKNADETDAELEAILSAYVPTDRIAEAAKTCKDAASEENGEEMIIELIVTYSPSVSLDDAKLAAAAIVLLIGK